MWSTSMPSKLSELAKSIVVKREYILQLFHVVQSDDVELDR